MKRKKETQRHNNATVAEFDDEALTSPFEEGGFRFVGKGVYTEGDRKGQTAVCKWFKKGHVDKETLFEKDILAMEKAVDLVARWNEQRIMEQLVRVNVPEVWTFDESDFFPSETKVLVEPFIANYRKFNSNTGWVTDSTSPWPQVMQALSHFTYHVSNGKYLLCDVQGGVYSNGVILTDPAIHSRQQKFGVTDHGTRGISTFFSKHKCNRYCHKDWIKPLDRTEYFPPKQGTSMSSSRQGSSTMMPPAHRAFQGPSTHHLTQKSKTSMPMISEECTGRATMLPPPPCFNHQPITRPPYLFPLVGTNMPPPIMPPPAANPNRMDSRDGFMGNSGIRRYAMLPPPSRSSTNNGGVSSLSALQPRQLHFAWE